MQEQELVQYLLDASKMFFGLSAKETGKLAYEFATALGKEVPATWKARQSAGEDWFSGFMRRHQNTLSVRTPEATSIGSHKGMTENAGVENVIQAKMQGWKMQEWKMRE